MPWPRRPSFACRLIFKPFRSSDRSWVSFGRPENVNSSVGKDASFWRREPLDLTVYWDEFISSFLSSAGNSSPSDASCRSLDWLLDTLVPDLRLLSMLPCICAAS